MARSKTAPSGRTEPLVIGIDASLNSTGLVALGSSSGKCASTHLIQPKSRGVLRLAEIQQYLRSWLTSLPAPVAHIAMERYGFDAQSRHAEIGEGGGAIKLVLFDLYGPEEPVSYPSLPAPNQVKKFVLGTGTGSKDQVRLGVYKRWKFEHSSNDVVDAYACAQIARYLVSLPMDATKPQMEVIYAMQFPPKKKGKSVPPSVHAEMPTDMRYE